MAPPSMRLKVAVGLKQDVVEIDAYPDTTWESAKLEACAAAGDLDANTHRLLFRGREPAPSDTVSSLGVKPTAKLMLLETEASRRDRARQQQEAQMEEMRRARAREFSERDDGGGKRVNAEHRATDELRVSPMERSRSVLAEHATSVTALERDAVALESRVANGICDQEAKDSVRDDREFLVFSDRAEKAIFALDAAETLGDETLRETRKALVKRIQRVLRRCDEARAKHANDKIRGFT